MDAMDDAQRAFLKILDAAPSVRAAAGCNIHLAERLRFMRLDSAAWSGCELNGCDLRPNDTSAIFWAFGAGGASEYAERNHGCK